MRYPEDYINKIICGDCLEVMKGMPDKCVDLVLTDPPYGIGEDGRRDISRVRVTEKWKNPTPKYYGNQYWDTDKISEEIFNEIFRISKNQIIFGGNYYSDLFTQSNCWIFWDKLTSGDFSDGELAWTSFNTRVRRYVHLWSGFKQQAGLVEKRVHPTQKPIRLFKWIIRDYSTESDLVLDPFLGSGTTAVACKELGRNFIGIEKEPKYVEIAQERLRILDMQPKLF